MRPKHQFYFYKVWTHNIHLLLYQKLFPQSHLLLLASLLLTASAGASAQIIQLFGRGVRLKGRDMSLMRSSRLDPVLAPKHLYLLETLNVFGVGADFMPA